MVNKINLYVFIQIIKSCTLVFFIFVSIAWLLQISRLFNYLGSLQIEFIKIFFLSTMLIPNIVNIIIPFIVLFGLLITFIKLDRDKEIIAIYSLGLSINNIKKPLILFSFIIGGLYLILSFYLSPLIYDIYKKKEFELRNLIDLNNINISNFIEINNNLILDFRKENGKFKDVFIRFNDETENIIYSKEANIIKGDEFLTFDLIKGFKLNFLDTKIEKLEFEKYKLKIPYLKNRKYNNIDKNSLTIFDLIEKKDIYLIIEKFFDFIITITIINFFYFFNIKTHQYNSKKITIFITTSILFLIIHNLIKNLELNNMISIYLLCLNIFLPLLLIFFNKKNLKFYEYN